MLLFKITFSNELFVSQQTNNTVSTNLLVLPWCFAWLCLAGRCQSPTSWLSSLGWVSTAALDCQKITEIWNPGNGFDHSISITVRKLGDLELTSYHRNHNGLIWVNIPGEIGVTIKKIWGREETIALCGFQNGNRILTLDWGRHQPDTTKNNLCKVCVFRAQPGRYPLQTLATVDNQWVYWGSSLTSSKK